MPTPTGIGWQGTATDHRWGPEQRPLLVQKNVAVKGDGLSASRFTVIWFTKVWMCCNVILLKNVHIQSTSDIHVNNIIRLYPFFSKWVNQFVFVGVCVCVCVLSCCMIFIHMVFEHFFPPFPFFRPTTSFHSIHHYWYSKIIIIPTHTHTHTHTHALPFCSTRSQAGQS